MAGSLPPLDFALLLIRLVWVAAVSILAGLNGQLTPQLAATLLAWILLSIFLATWRPIAVWSRSLAVAADFLFAVVAVGIAGTQLWWSLLAGGLLAAIGFGWIGGLAFPSFGAIALLVIGLLSGFIQAEQLGSIGRAVIAVLILTPITAWIGVWLRGRIEQDNSPDEAAMLGMAAYMNAAVGDDDFPEIVMDFAVSGLMDDMGYSMQKGDLKTALLLPSQDGYTVAAGGPTSGESPIVIREPKGMLGEALISGQAQIRSSTASDPEMDRLGMTGEKLCVPLMMNGRPEGALIFAHPKRDFFSEQRLDRLAVVGTQAGIALHNARIVHALKKERDRITETEEEARRKLARNLHDGPTQTIAAIAMRLNFAGRLVDRDKEAAQEEIKTLEEIARQTTKDIRHMLFTLRPLVLETKGLVTALFELASKLYETHGQVVLVEADSDVADDLEMNKQAVLFFIAEEAINNAYKHAQAANIWVGLSRSSDDQIVLEVRDDGVGFNVGAVDANYEQRGSLGMVNMRERSELVDGVLRIDSAEGEGTHITLEVPLTNSPR